MSDNTLPTAAADTNGFSLDAHKAETWAAWALIWNGDYSHATNLIADDFRVHVTLLDGSPDTAIRGPEGLTTWIDQTRVAFSTMVFNTELGPFADGDYLIGRWEATGTYAGGWPGATAPAGTTVSFTGTDILRFENGKAVEYWLHSDMASLFTQLGMK